MGESEPVLRDAAADEEVGALTQRLLAAYQEALDSAQHAPIVRMIRYSSTGAGRHIASPRLRLFLSYFVVLHVRRATGALKRRMHRAAVMADEPRRFEREIKLLERFEESLPGIPSRSLLAGFAALVLLVSYGAASLAGASQDDLKPFGAVISSVAQLDRGGIMDAFGRYGWITAYFTALGVAVSLWVVLLLPMTSFQLKRTVFNLVPGARAKLPHTTLVENRPPLHGIYTIEDELFAKLDATPPRELRLDLVLEAVLIGLTIGVAVYGLIDFVHAGNLGHHFLQPKHGTLRLLGTLALVGLLVLRLAALAQASRGRRQPTEVAALDSTRRPVALEELDPAAWLRRALAFLVDAAAITIIWSFSLVALDAVFSENTTFALGYLFLFTLLPAAYILPWLYLGSRDRGLRTPGKRLFGVSVVAEDGTQPTARMVLVREIGCKGLLFGVFTGWLIVPWLANYFWPFRDARRRALHDRLAGTMVVRVRKAQEAEKVKAVPAPV